MSKYLKYLFTGTLFGIILSKAEVISWFRIYEMFKFQSFHMYGVIGSAVICGIIIVALIKKSGMKSILGKEIKLKPKTKSVARYLFGGIIFGFGWALTGACPGPLFTLVGNGYLVFMIVIISSIFGTFLYGLVRENLPH